LQRPHIQVVTLLFIAGVLGCDTGAPSGALPVPPVSSRATVSASASAPAGSAVPPKKAKADRTHRAARCGECHEKMYQEWRESPHARTNDTALYAALRKDVPGDSCDRCHEPLRALGAAAEFAQAEDVSCEVCHRIEKVTVHAGFAEAPLLTAHGMKFGPRCDPRRPYFHKAECRPVFQKSELCAACHLLSLPQADGSSLPVHSEFSDWSKGPYPARGKTCQSCHMQPGVRAELATGEPERDDVADHGFWGRERRLEGTALTAHAQVARHGDAVTVQVEVKNAGAGHPIPAGGPGRQLVLRVIALGEGDRELARDERVFERRLVDAEGRTAPFTRAVRVGSDTRITPLQTRRERFELVAPGASEIRVSLLRRTDPGLAAALGVPAGREEPGAQLSLALGAGAGVRRALLERVAQTANPGDEVLKPVHGSP